MEEGRECVSKQMRARYVHGSAVEADGRSVAGVLIVLFEEVSFGCIQARLQSFSLGLVDARGFGAANADVRKRRSNSNAIEG